MTDQEIIEYYSSLLLYQYAAKRKAVAMVQAFVSMVVMNQLPTQVMNAYDLETAVGVQLDVLGKYAGVSRQGYDFSGPVTLDDDDFRLIVKMAIIQNNSGSSLSDIQNLLAIYFADVIRVFDYTTMRMDYLVNSDAASQLVAEFFIKQGSLPRPMGVQLSAIIYAPFDSEFFGLRTYDLPLYHASPLNTYDNYNMNSPWLSYSNAIYE